MAAQGWPAPAFGDAPASGVERLAVVPRVRRPRLARARARQVGVDEVLLRQWPLVPSEVRVSTTCSDAVGTTTRSFECRAVPEKGTAFYDFRAWAEL